LEDGGVEAEGTGRRRVGLVLLALVVVGFLIGGSAYGSSPEFLIAQMVLYLLFTSFWIWIVYWTATSHGRSVPGNGTISFVTGRRLVPVWFVAFGTLVTGFSLASDVPDHWKDISAQLGELVANVYVVSKVVVTSLAVLFVCCARIDEVADEGKSGVE
jgi:hypothetical protein